MTDRASCIFVFVLLMEIHIIELITRMKKDKIVNRMNGYYFLITVYIN